MLVSSNEMFSTIKIGIGIDYLKEMELKLRELELRNLEFLTKNLICKLIYHFYDVNTYMWCYQYTRTNCVVINNNYII